jgi:hypothetical protein
LTKTLNLKNREQQTCPKIDKEIEDAQAGAFNSKSLNVLLEAQN